MFKTSQKCPEGKWIGKASHFCEEKKNEIMGNCYRINNVRDYVDSINKELISFFIQVINTLQKCSFEIAEGSAHKLDIRLY